MNRVIIERATAKGKKWKATFPDGTVTSFGATGYEDYTTHGDEARQKNYISRHRKDPHGMKTAGELSRTLLWYSPSWTQAKKNYERKHGVTVVWRR